VSGYTFVVNGGADDLNTDRADIEKIITSSQQRVTIDNVGLSMAIPPNWQLVDCPS
jgi:hypothetical protein